MARPHLTRRGDYPGAFGHGDQGNVGGKHTPPAGAKGLILLRAMRCAR
jgi:hypothetical protein